MLYLNIGPTPAASSSASTPKFRRQRLNELQNFMHETLFTYADET